MRKARWTRGAYSASPALQGREDQREVPCATAHVECWRGSVDELTSVVDVLRASVGASSTLSGSLTTNDGRRQTGMGEREIRQLVSSLTSDNALVLRVEAEGENGRRGSLTARRVVPGLALQLCDGDAGRALGNAELVFRRMMTGYVDRMAGSRGVAWMFSALAPIALIGMATSHGAASGWVRATLAGVAVLAAAGTLLTSYGQLLYSEPLTVVEKLPSPRDSRWWMAGARDFLSRSLVRRTLSVLGALLIGALGSRLAKYLPFP